MSAFVQIVRSTSAFNSFTIAIKFGSGAIEFGRDVFSFCWIRGA